MILIEVQYTAGESAFMTLQSEMDGPLDDSELYWLTISNMDQRGKVDIFNIRKVSVGHA